MRRGLHIIPILALLVASSGCIRMYKYAKSGGTGKYYPPRAEIKFTGRPSTGLDSLIRIDGKYVDDLYISPVRFYTDGRAFIEREYGLYTFKDDTIMVDTYYMWGNLQKYSYKFAVIDSVTIRMVSRQSDYPVDGIEDLSPRLNQIYNFEQDAVPKFLRKFDINEPEDRFFNELYKRKWLWEREEDWERWMAEHYEK
ncbi:MAG: hypothetical protein NC127_08690 [Muribaculum sp.]|nr:hypothetical protein [Muribaculum sp.]